MVHQSQAVRAGRPLDSGLRFHIGTNDIDLSEHGEGEQVGPRAVRHQQFGDVAAAHVRCRAQGCFPVAESPVPGRLRQRGTFGQEFTHAGGVTVRDTYHLAYPDRVLGRERFGVTAFADWRAALNRAAGALGKDGRDGAEGRYGNQETASRQRMGHGGLPGRRPKAANRAGTSFPPCRGAASGIAP